MLRNAVMRVGIVGAGHIAEKAAKTLNAMDGAECLAIASRSLEKARAFARTWSIPRAYGSYEELLNDPEVDLVYVATPHSHHFGVTCSAIEKGKACLVEKSFMANAVQTETVLNLSRRHNVLVAEAIWTRYLPAVQIIRDIIASGVIGPVRAVSATLAYEMSDKERILSPALCGGALLDLGVYCINFVRTYCNSQIVKKTSLCTKFDTGTDKSAAIAFELADGTVAQIFTSAACQGDNTGIIAGTEASIHVDDINNPQKIRVFGKRHVLIGEHAVPEQITGFEYEFAACRAALSQGSIEVPQMPHSEILEVMRIMDGLRRDWDIRFPMD